jgi:hypothetical protein
VRYRVPSSASQGDFVTAPVEQIKAQKVVPWGRSFQEYLRMFALSENDLASGVLDCAAGPAGFNAEMHRRGHKAVSCDPLYRLSAAQISRQIENTFASILKTTEEHRANFIWRDIASPEELGKLRMQAMNQFLADFPAGACEGRYVIAALPALPFSDRRFGLALCSHFLFTYTSALSLSFHLEAIREMCRVASEARIFPLVPSFETAKSPNIASLLEELVSTGYACEIKPVPYEFQRGANEMLCVRRL